MSDETTATAAPTPTLEIRELVKTNPETGEVVASITPVIEVVKRGAMEGNPYVTVTVTKENLNDYVKFRGIDSVLDILNAKERLDAQEALNYVGVQLENEKGEGTVFKDALANVPDEKKPKTKTGEFIEKWVINWTKDLVDKLYQTLTEGKVRGGLTIAKIEEELIPDLRNQLNRLLTVEIPAAKTQEEKFKLFEKATELSKQDQDYQAEAERIRASRTPRKPRGSSTPAPAAAQAAG